MFVDSHVNLHAAAFDEDREAVIARAREAGVGVMLTICDKIASFDAVVAISRRHADIWASVGAHPHEAKDHSDLTVEALCELAADERVVGIGETGLDFHYDLSPRAQQEAVFRVHIEAARRTGLPLIVHTREADETMAAILEREHAAGAFPILMHCYTSGAELAQRAAALGAWFSVSGIATFRAAEDVRAVIAQMPADRLLLETDCPYLAPVPMRGRRNEPAFLPHVATGLAKIRGWSLEETQTRTTAAFFELFEKARRPSSVALSVPA